MIIHGDLIRMSRKAKNLSQQGMSDALDGVISRAQISLLESGKWTEPSLRQAIAIANLFDLSVYELVDEEIPGRAFLIAAEIADAKRRLADALVGGVA